MGKKSRLDALDNITLALFGASLAIPALIGYYGLDVRLMVIPSLCYGFWILIIGYAKPKVSFDGQPDRALVERIRGWAYVLGFPVCSVTNFIFIFVLPHTLDYFLFGIVTGSAALFLCVSIVQAIFRKDIANMDVEQHGLLLSMLSWVGASIIFVSVGLPYPTIMTTWTSYPLAMVVAYSVTAVIMFCFSFDRYKKSSKLCKQLADSMRESRLSKKKQKTESVEKNM